MDILSSIESEMNKTRGVPGMKSRPTSKILPEKMEVDSPPAGLGSFRIPKRTTNSNTSSAMRVSDNGNSADHPHRLFDTPLNIGDAQQRSTYSERDRSRYDIFQRGEMFETNDIKPSNLKDTNASGVRLATQVQIKSNDFKISLECAVLEVFKYNVDVTVVKIKKNGERQEFDATLAPKKVSSLNEKRRALKNVMSLFLKQYGISEFDVAYDSGSCLYTKNCLSQNNITVVYPKENLKERAVHYLGGNYLKEVRVTIQLTKMIPVRKGICNQDINSRELCSFIEVLLDNILHRKSDYIEVKDGMCFHKGSDNTQDISMGLVVKTGFKKSIRIVKSGPNAIPVLNLKVCKRPFYKEQGLIDFLAEKLGCPIDNLEYVLRSRRSEASKFVRNILATTVYNVPRDVHIAVVGKESAEEQIVPVLNTTVFQFFQDKYCITLQYPNLPLIGVKKGRSFLHYPIEMLKLSRYQTVSIDKLDKQAQVVSATRLMPEEYATIIMQQMRKSNFTSDNAHLASFGIKISENPNIEMAEVLQMPAIKTGTKIHDPSRFYLPNGMNWKETWRERYFVGAKVPKTMLVNYDNASRDERQLRQVINKLAQEGTKHDMMFDERKVDYTCWHSMGREDFLHEVKLLTNKGYKFILLISPGKRCEEVHHNLKDAEQRFNIPTQHISAHTLGLKGKIMGTQVIHGILSKINQKLGGINYNISITDEMCFTRNTQYLRDMYFSKQRMYVGLNVSHPAAMSVFDQQSKSSVRVPSTVGLCFTTTHPTAMRGTYWFQPPREHLIPQLRKAMIPVLKLFKEETGAYPKEVVVFRGGVSEGEFNKVRDFEGAGPNGIDAAFRDLNIDPSLYIISVQEKTNSKILLAKIPHNARPVDANVPAGTSMINGVTNPDFVEVILVSQMGQIGTSRCTRLTICYQHGGKVMDAETLRFTANAMCYAHGVSTCPTGLPSPLYGACNLSKRGHAVLKNSNDFGDTMSMRSGESDGFAEESGLISQNYCERMSEELAVTLKNTQFWA